eukprot:2955301-Prymnesium_polylepis.2
MRRRHNTSRSDCGGTCSSFEHSSSCAGFSTSDPSGSADSPLTNSRFPMCSTRTSMRSICSRRASPMPSAPIAWTSSPKRVASSASSSRDVPRWLRMR